MDKHESFDKHLEEIMDTLSKLPVDSDEYTKAVRNFRALVDTVTELPEYSSPSTPVPTTVWGRVKAGAAHVWDNETTRVFIKAGGSFAGVGLVVWSTVHRDHVIDRQAMTQANQHPQ